MKRLILLLFLFPTLLFSQEKYQDLVDSLKYVENVAYVEYCHDPIIWQIVSKGKDAVPALINKLSDDSPIIELYVPFFGGEYTVADVAYIAINEIITDIPTYPLLGIEPSKSCGSCNYWYYLRAEKENRRKFQQSVKEWYQQYKDSITWVDSSTSVTQDCSQPYTIGGHYRLNKEVPERTPSKKALDLVKSIYRSDEVDILPNFIGGYAKLKEYLYTNFDMTDSINDNLYWRNIHVGFIVDKDGKLDDINIIPIQRYNQNRTDYMLTSAEVKRIFQAMPNWQPALKDGKPVASYHSIPISGNMFYNKRRIPPIPDEYDNKGKITDSWEPPILAPPTPEYEFNAYHPWVSKQKKPSTTAGFMPYFPGGKDFFIQFMRNNFQYPGYEVNGRIVVQFTVATTGHLTDIEIETSLDPEYDKEVMRIMALMPKWIPASNRDIVVNANCSLLFTFSPQLNLSKFTF